MNARGIRDQILDQLLEDNFVNSRQYRKIMEAEADVSLRYYFQNISSRRSQFAVEIGEEISYYSGRKPFLSTVAYDRNRTETETEPIRKNLKKAIKLNKSSLQKYQNALCQIHEGSCREILLRHKAFMENCDDELRSLKTLLKYRQQHQHGQADETLNTNRQQA